MIISDLLNAYNDFLHINYNEEGIDKLPKKLDIIAYQTIKGDNIHLTYNRQKKIYKIFVNEEFVDSWKASIKECIEDLKNYTDLDYSEIVWEYVKDKLEDDIEDDIL